MICIMFLYPSHSARRGNLGPLLACSTSRSFILEVAAQFHPASFTIIRFQSNHNTNHALPARVLLS